MPMAVSPSSSARATNSCGCEAPRRKEKLAATASSAKALSYIPTRTNSPKQAVHEPARRCRFPAVKAFAVEPETMTLAVFDEIVIAGRRSYSRRVGRAPPFIGDPFRALRAGDVVSHSAPAEAPRWPLGNERGDFGRLCFRQQQQRPCFFFN